MNKSLFSDRIKELRIKNKKTQEELAEIFGITPTGVSYWESGKSIPNSITLEKLAIYFNVTLDYLIGNKEMDDNDKMKIIFRKTEDVPEADRETLRKILDSTINAFLSKENDKT